MRLRALILAALMPLSAQALTLSWPAACTLGKDCFVQNYVDHGDSRDFTCNALTYPGHDGTDIRLRSLAAMRAGVNVLAPADGTVIGVRNNIEDKSIRDAEGSTEAGMKDVEGHNCGNGVHIQHADGYHTQLCHMQQGSVIVHVGQQLKAGDVLGKIGLSGQTEFPHVHLSVWKDEVKIDPFTAGAMKDACATANEAHTSATLWQTPVPYLSGVLLGDGFIDRVPEHAALDDTPTALATLPTSAPYISYWVEVMGLHTGDVLSLKLMSPSGKTFAEHSQTFDHPLAYRFTFVGQKNTAPLPVGQYKATVTLTRDGKPIIDVTRTATVQ